MSIINPGYTRGKFTNYGVVHSNKQSKEGLGKLQCRLDDNMLIVKVVLRVVTKKIKTFPGCVGGVAVS